MHFTGLQDSPIYNNIINIPSYKCLERIINLIPDLNVYLFNENTRTEWLTLINCVGTLRNKESRVDQTTR